jgi:hypothetical protein
LGIVRRRWSDSSDRSWRDYSTLFQFIEDACEVWLQRGNPAQARKFLRPDCGETFAALGWGKRCPLRCKLNDLARARPTTLGKRSRAVSEVAFKQVLDDRE